MANLLIKAVSGGIGLASEAIASRKASKLAKQNSNLDLTEEEPGQHVAPSSSREINERDLPSYEVAVASSSSGSRQRNQTPSTEKRQENQEANYSSDSSGQSHPRDLGRRSLDDESLPDPDQKRPLDERDEESDEELWEFDEAQQEIIARNGETPPSYEESITSIDDVINSFNAMHLDKSEPETGLVRSHTSSSQPAPALSPPIGRLPCPVIIPQRRPGTLDRGFVRAYAPVLNESGIDQATFMDFLSAFEKAIQISPVFDVLNLAVMGVGFIPEPTAQIVSAVGGIAFGVGRAVYTIKSKNHFLKAMNEKLFKPRGLVCFIMTYEPDSDQAIQSRNLGRGGGVVGALRGQIKSRMKSNENVTHGELELPEAAPLIFPAVESLPDAQKHKAGFFNDYLDRRAQATYIAKNPDSRLAVGPSPQFASRFSDPNHPVNSGNLISFVTGGAVNRPRKADRRRRHRDNGLRDLDDGGYDGGYRRRRRGRSNRGGGPVGGLIGLAGTLVTAAQDAHQQRKSRKQLEEEEATTSRGITSEQSGYRLDSKRPVAEQPPDHLHPAYASSQGSRSLSNPSRDRNSSSSLQRAQSTDPDVGPSSRSTASLEHSTSHPFRQDMYRGPGGAAAQSGGKRGVSRLIKKNVLYLMICNMPTEEEMQNAKKLTSRMALEATRSTSNSDLALDDLAPPQVMVTPAFTTSQARAGPSSGMEHGVIYPDELEHTAGASLGR